MRNFFVLLDSSLLFGVSYSLTLNELVEFWKFVNTTDTSA